MAADGLSVDVVRAAHLDGVVVDEVRRLWATHGALDDDAMADRLAQLVCVLRDRAGIVVGTCSVRAADIPLPGAPRLWVARRYLAQDVPPAAEEALLDAAFVVLDDEHVPGGDGPVGLVVPSSRAFADDQAHVRWFTGARTGSERLAVHPLPEGYRLEAFDEVTGVTVTDVLDLWEAEGALSAGEAARRVHDVVSVALAPNGALAGVATATLVRVDQVGMDLFTLWACAGAAHRRADVATNVAALGAQLLRDRYVSGRDRRGSGIRVDVDVDGEDTARLVEYFPGVQVSARPR